MARHRATLSVATDFAYALCARLADDAFLEGLDLSAWTMAVSGGEPVRAETLQRFAARFASAGFRSDAFRPYYGLTETLCTAIPQGDAAPRVQVAASREGLAHGRLRAPTREEAIALLVGNGSPLGDTEVIAVDPETATPLPPGGFINLEGQFQAQEQATGQIAALSRVSLALMFLVLYSRYRSAVLAGIVMANIPLALVGSVVAMWLAEVTLSVATMVGFITLAGIATRNGILKISHYINLCRFEGESFSQAMIVRGSLERLTPVLMTALVAAFALVPLLLAGDAPGKEILHPVAVVIFGGLVSSTLLDTLLTPLLYWRFGREPTERLLHGTPEDGTQAPSGEAF
jgi:hypothetical protein